MLERNLTYLGTPYTDADSSVRKGRFIRVSKVAAWLMKHGHIVYSPISHCHPIAQNDLPKKWEFWQHYDLPFLQYSRLFIVLPLDGWKLSIGLRGEYKEAMHLKLPIMYVKGNLDTCNHDELSLTWTRPRLSVE